MESHNTLYFASGFLDLKYLTFSKYPLYCCKVIHDVDVPQLCINLPVRGHLGCFHYFWYMNEAAIRIYICVVYEHEFSFFLGKLTVRFLDQMWNVYFLTRKLPIFQSIYISLIHTKNVCVGKPKSFSAFGLFTLFQWFWSYILLSFAIIILFHIFLMANNIKHLSRYYLSSLMKYLFKFLCF